MNLATEREVVAPKNPKAANARRAAIRKLVSGDAQLPALK
jgi:hypothetical protein